MQKALFGPDFGFLQGLMFVQHRTHLLSIYCVPGTLLAMIAWKAFELEGKDLGSGLSCAVSWVTKEQQHRLWMLRFLPVPGRHWDHVTSKGPSGPLLRQVTALGRTQPMVLPRQV